MSHYIFTTFLTIASIFILQAQDVESKPSDGRIIDFGVGMGLNLPLGELNKRYGSNLNFSIGGDYITSKNWVINGEFIFLFSDNVKEDVLAPLRTASGTLLGDDEQAADIIFKERGLYLGLGVGKLIPFSNDSRSGIKLVLNGGILQHQIKFSDERNSLAQIRAGRYVGYDRLTRGFALKETVAYKHLSKDRRLNFEFGLDFVQGFTSEVRAFNYDTGLATIGKRIDILIGARLTWNLPFYKGSMETIYY